MLYQLSYTPVEPESAGLSGGGGRAQASPRYFTPPRFPLRVW